MSPEEILAAIAETNTRILTEVGHVRNDVTTLRTDITGEIERLTDRVTALSGNQQLTRSEIGQARQDISRVWDAVTGARQELHTLEEITVRHEREIRRLWRIVGGIALVLGVVIIVLIYLLLAR